jgi:CHASE2 domain-containing sensor protein
VDGVARQIAVRLADDSGKWYRAMAVEAVRVADGTPQEGVTDELHALLLGPRTIPLDNSPASVEIQPASSTRVLHGGRLTVDYIGPAGSFGPVTYSLADVVAGRVPGEKIRGKFVLIGATAASLGERMASPLRALHRCARGSAWRPHAGRGGSG